MFFFVLITNNLLVYAFCPHVHFPNAHQERKVKNSLFHCWEWKKHFFSQISHNFFLLGLETNQLILVFYASKIELDIFGTVANIVNCFFWKKKDNFKNLHRKILCMKCKKPVILIKQLTWFWCIISIKPFKKTNLSLIHLWRWLTSH